MYILRNLVLAVFCLAALSAGAANAQEKPLGGSDPTPIAAPAIDLDPATNEIRFLIDGKVVARFDASGLQVRENIEYGGMLKDTGPAVFDRRERQGAPHEE